MFSLHRISVVLFLSFLYLQAPAGNPFAFRGGAAEKGTGLTCLMKKSFWSSFTNQALLASNKSFAAGVSYENRFGIQELSTCTAGAIFRTGKTSEGVIFSQFGYPMFRRVITGISCGMQLGKNIDAGVQADYISEILPREYDNTRILTFEAGAIFRISEDIISAVHVFNPLDGIIRKSPLPSAITLGVGADLSKNLFAGIETSISTGEKMAIRTGFEYSPSANFHLMGGFSTENTSFSFGLGYRIRSIRVDIGFSTHNRLGVTSALSFIFIPGGRAKK